MQQLRPGLSENKPLLLPFFAYRKRLVRQTFIPTQLIIRVRFHHDISRMLTNTPQFILFLYKLQSKQIYLAAAITILITEVRLNWVITWMGDQLNTQDVIFNCIESAWSPSTI